MAAVLAGCMGMGLVLGGCSDGEAVMDMAGGSGGVAEDVIGPTSAMAREIADAGAHAGVAEGLSMSVPGDAGLDGADGQEGLERVASAVKSMLGLDTEEYDLFRGEPEMDPLETRWRLYWSGDAGSLDIMVTDAGLVTSYDRRDMDDAAYGRTMPAFVAGSESSAADAASRFVKKCLGADETLVLDRTASFSGFGDGTYTFHGDIRLKGLPAGIGCTVSVRGSDNQVMSFSRTDWRGRVRDEIPAPDSQVDKADARAKFWPTVDLECEYVLATDGSNKAYLAYVPRAMDTYYVDAATGELVNLTEIADSVHAPLTWSDDDRLSKNEAMTDSAGVTGEADGGLTEAELAGSGRFGDAMDKDTLESAARGYGMLGLDNYNLAGVDYRVSDLSGEDAEDGIIAVLTFTHKSMDGWRRMVTLDARSGKLERVYSSMWTDSGEAAGLRKIDETAAEKAAADFGQELCGKQFAKCVTEGAESIGTDSSVMEYSLVYCQEEAGYLYRGNEIDIGIDATDGSLSRYSFDFDDSVAFEDPDGILTPEEAVEAWLDTYETTLGYVQVPFAVDATAPEFDKLDGMGVSYMYKLVTGWALERPGGGYVMWVRARDGKPVEPDWSMYGGYSYDDVDGSTALGDEIMTLARYGIGVDGGRFDTDGAADAGFLDDMLAGLGGSVYGYYGYDTVRSAGKAGKTPVTRGMAVKAILSRVVPAEMLGWAFDGNLVYPDTGKIPVDMRGAAAMAGACGMLDTASPFGADTELTRGDVAGLVYAFLARNSHTGD